MSYENIIKKLGEGETTFFENSFEEIALKGVPEKSGVDFTAKPSHKPMYPIPADSPVVADGLLEGKEITEKAFINY